MKKRKLRQKKKKEEQIQIIDEKLKKKDKVTSYACIFIFSSAVWLLIKSDYISGWTDFEHVQMFGSPSTPILENPEYQTRWYFKYFLGKRE